MSSHQSTSVITHGTPFHVTMWAIFLVDFHSFLWKSNLVVDRAAHISNKVLFLSDLCFDASFAYLTVHALKTIQFQERLFPLPLPRILGNLLCPIATLVDHLRINQVPQDMPLFLVRFASSLSKTYPIHILVLFWPGLSKLSVLILLATPLMVLGAMALPLPLTLKYQLS